MTHAGPANSQKSINVIYHVTQLKKKNHVMRTVDAGKACGTNLIPIHHKSSQQVGNRGERPQIDEEHLQRTRSRHCT